MEHDTEKHLKEEAGRRVFTVSARSISVAAWLLTIGILVAVKGRHDAEWMIGLCGFGLSYQLILAVVLGSAFDAETELAPRRIFAMLWVGSFAVMLLNLLSACYFAIRMTWVLAILTPITCIVCGLYTIHRGHNLSGAIAFSLSMVSWMSPIFMLWLLDFFVH